MRNFGDDLFGYVAHHAQRKYWPDFTSSVLAPQIADLDLEFSVPWLLGVAYHRHDRIGALSRAAAASSAMLLHEKLIYAGGSIFTGRSGVRSITRVLPRRRISAIGVSVGPFASERHRRRATSEIEKLEFITVRDQESARVAASLGVRAIQSADLAGLLPSFLPLSIKRSRSSKRRLVFVPCSNKSTIGLTADAFCESFIKSICRIDSARELKVEILILNDHPKTSDEPLARTVSKQLRNEGFDVKAFSYSSVGLNRAVEILASSDLVVSGRLHGAIVAYMYQAPFVLNEYHEKCASFLDDVGVPDQLRSSLVGLQEAIENALQSPQMPGIAPADYSELAARSFTSAPWYRRCGV
ncbi:polysaccharide pyruvyl transferase family protein [Luteimonas sp. MJ293]|uniref:polysaccharide pyruvyl transferase family protein n=1 Tax=Luteimonas sp. MJ146 TaxID=3129240 RepID=UPI0031BB3C9B